ncbi:energy transducer TonB [Oligoflexus tunisiensis]|uniref:energy transducer TonB n=1 Tax=Oligoflexus tunisiensis TaxID=708132 RepID=UPI00114CFD64|nr:energy transducer TonB [Oligoflexus tunisiensis]
MKRESQKEGLFFGLPRQGWFWLVVTILFSALIHLISLINLDKLPHRASMPHPRTKREPSKVTVKITQKPKLKEKDENDQQKQKRIVETPMAPTEAPKDSRFEGAQDHKTDKETRVSNLTPRPKAADAGAAGSDTKSVKEQSKTVQQAQPLHPQKMTVTPERLAPKKKTELLLSPNGSVSVAKPDRKPRNVYESLMPQAEEMRKQVAAGYQDYVDDNVEVGERVDLNTSNFRYLAYFTSLRKAFELVWTYPSEAVQRGLQGEVKVEFTILKDGTVARVKVIDGSGHRILDDAVVEAIRLAAPFTPLPVGMKKERLTVVGSFRYVLTNYAGAM